MLLNDCVLVSQTEKKYLPLIQRKKVKGPNFSIDKKIFITLFYKIKTEKKLVVLYVSYLCHFFFVDIVSDL